MIQLVFWTAVAICAIAQVFIIAGAVRALPPEEGVRTIPRSSRSVEIGWTIVPAVGLALILYFTHQAVVGPSANPESGAAAEAAP